MIPKYKKSPLKVQVQEERLGDLSAKAEAQGQGRLAQAHAGLGAQEMAGARQSAAQGVRDLAQNLNNFNNNLNTGLAAGVTLFQTHAKRSGIEQAEHDLKTRADRIAEIQNDDDLPEAKIDKINKERYHLESTLNGIYGEAYNSVVTAAFSNDMAIQAQKQVLEISRLAKSPEDFKKLWKDNTEKALEFAPSDATNLVQRRLYDKAGVAMFASLYKSAQTSQKKQQTQSSKDALTIFKNQYYNAINTGDISGSQEYYKAIENNMKDSVASGRITPEKYNIEMKNILTEGLLIPQKENFSTMNKAGNGVVAYEAFNKKVQSLDLNQYDYKKIATRLKFMETELKSTFVRAAENVKLSFDNNVKPNPADMEIIKKYAKYGDAEKVKDFVGLQTAYQKAEQMKKLTLSEQNKALEPVKNGDSVDVIKSKNALAKIIKDKESKAKEDPIGLGESEGLFEENLDLSPDTITPDAVLERDGQRNVAKSRYDTVTADKFFKPNEVDVITDFLSGDAPAEEKMKYLQNFEGLDSKALDVVIEQLDEKDTFIGTSLTVLKDTKLFNSGNEVTDEKRRAQRKSVVADILDGRKYVKSPLLATDKKEVRQFILKGFDKTTLRDPVETNRILQAVEAVYSKRAIEANIDESEIVMDSDILQKSLDDVLGVKGERGYAPIGVTKNRYNNWLEWMSGDNYVSHNASDDDLGEMFNANTIEDKQDRLKIATPVRIPGTRNYKFLKPDGTYIATPDKKLYILPYSAR